jgi:hypothetical protein
MIQLLNIASKRGNDSAGKFFCQAFGAVYKANEKSPTVETIGEIFFMKLESRMAFV